MINIKIEKTKKNEPIFKLKYGKRDYEKYPFLKRIIMESKRCKGEYSYRVPLKFLYPIFNNIKKEDLKINKNSITFFLEFSDEFDERYYYITEAHANYMKKWREVNCPYIYKITLNIEKNTMDKEVAFKRLLNS